MDIYQLYPKQKPKPPRPVVGPSIDPSIHRSTAIESPPHRVVHTTAVRPDGQHEQWWTGR